MVGYFNTVVAERQGVFDSVPAVAKYIIMAVSGTGPLWFIQVLWLLSLVLLIVRALDRHDRFWTWCGKAGIVWIIMLGVLFWAGEQTLIRNPRPESADGLLNLYKPLFYMVPFLLGYFVFSHDEVQEKVGKAWIPLMVSALIAGGVLIGTTFGQDNTSPEYLGSPLNCIYGWLMCLAMMGWFKTKFDCSGRFAGYMTRSSYGIYIVHYLVIASLGYMMKTYTQLPPWSMYVILTVAVFTLSPLLYEIIRRIPVVRWCVLGE
jgi:surface polysaccharide O-acyltransferase-like enzyme